MSKENDKLRIGTDPMQCQADSLNGKMKEDFSHALTKTSGLHMSSL